MRVLFMMSSIAMGGGERVLVSVLPYFQSEGIVPVLCTLNRRRDSLLVEAFEKTGLRRIDLGAARMLDPNAWRRFATLLREEPFDVVHTQDQDTHIYGAVAHHRLKVPIVMTRHVLEEPTPTLKQYLRSRLVLLAARYGVDKIVAVSEAVRRLFARQANVPLSKIVTIYNGIDLERFRLNGSGPQPTATHPSIIMIGVLREGKGHDVLFKAIPRIRQTLPNVRIKLVGSGKLDKELRQQATPFSDTVEFLGERDDVPQLLQSSNVLVLPSWSEALPTVLIEAGAASLPVVATNVGGTPEIVEDGRTGYIVPPGDPDALAARLIELLQNPVLALQMGQAARERILAKFSLQQQARQTVALYESVLQRR